MTRTALMTRLWFAGLILFLATAAGVAQDVYQSISPEKVEDILRDMNIEFRKTTSTTDNEVFFYNFKHKSISMALNLSKGKTLMLYADFDKVPHEHINKWNQGSYFGRAILHKDAKGEFSSIEYRLDVTGGVTDNTVRKFLNRFFDEATLFVGHINSGRPAVEEVVYRTVNSGSVEKILRDLNLNFKKSEPRQNIQVYEYEKNNFKIRVVNFGGKDVMIDANFRQATLEEINSWNVNRKFIRAVLYQNPNGGQYSSLESNLDCEGGITDGVLRHFIVTFDAEVTAFAKHLNR